LQYKGDNPADCIEIGSIGPCSQGECGMTGKPAGDGVTVVYTYTYGCKNTFTLTMSAGSALAPGQVTSNECSYTATWAGLDAAGALAFRDATARRLVCGRHSGACSPLCPLLCFSPCALCGAPSVGGGGGRWIITIPTIVIVAVALGALAGGTGYNIKKRQMQGAEAVPFIGFWRALPGLVKDGCMLSYVHGREFSLMVRATTHRKATRRTSMPRCDAKPELLPALEAQHALWPASSLIADYLLPLCARACGRRGAMCVHHTDVCEGDEEAVHPRPWVHALRRVDKLRDDTDHGRCGGRPGLWRRQGVDS
jgi:hypothetical protein